MKTITKYSKTDEGRSAFIQDALSISDESFKVIHLPVQEKDKLLSTLNLIADIILIIITSPVIIISAIYGGLKWLFKFKYPISNEGKQLMTTRKYLHQCKKYRYETF
jgi:hypothetical protein